MGCSPPSLTWGDTTILTGTSTLSAGGLPHSMDVSSGSGTQADRPFGATRPPFPPKVTPMSHPRGVLTGVADDVLERARLLPESRGVRVQGLDAGLAVTQREYTTVASSQGGGHHLYSHPGRVPLPSRSLRCVVKTGSGLVHAQRPHHPIGHRRPARTVDLVPWVGRPVYGLFIRRPPGGAHRNRMFSTHVDLRLCDSSG